MHGPCGTGKSSAARLIVEARQRACGIVDTMVEQLHAKNIAKMSAISGSASLLDYTCSADSQPYVIVDEVNQFKAVQQEELRALMDSMVVGRLILTTNKRTAVDYALRDRCRQIEVLPASALQWLPRAEAILAAEQVQLPRDVVYAAIEEHSSVRDRLRELWSLVRRVRKATAAAMPSVVPIASTAHSFVVLNTPNAAP